ncbi:MAG: sensor domain-containing diguanylate cyclase [Lachnospiraceae bacterium]
MRRSKENEYKKKIAKLEFSLLLDEEKYRLVSEYADCGLWEYDIADDKMIQRKQLKGKYSDALVVIEHYGETMLQEQKIHPHDRVAFDSYCKNLKSGEPTIASECRILTSENTYLWVRFEGLTVFDKEEHPVKVVGKTLDITKDKKERETLLQQAQTDALTGLLNKAAIREVSVDCIYRCSTHSDFEQHAVFLIDIDNFKAVNDTYGHLYGDYTLEQVASVLRNVFTKEDAIGRVGGDEFAIMTKGYFKDDEIKQHAEALLENMRNTVFKKENNVTISVGIAVYPTHGHTYEELFGKADIALYESKHIGKNAYTFFEKGMEHQDSKPAMGRANYRTTVPTALEKDVTGFEQHLLKTAAKVLYQETTRTGSIEQKISLLLEEIGSYYELDSICICTNYSSDAELRVKEYWNKKGTHEKHIYLQSEDSEHKLLNQFCDRFAKQDVVVLTDSKEGIHPIEQYFMPGDYCLQCAFFQAEQFKGYIAYTRELETWTSQEVTLFTMLSNMMSTLLLCEEKVKEPQ